MGISNKKYFLLTLGLVCMFTFFGLTSVADGKSVTDPACDNFTAGYQLNPVGVNNFYIGDTINTDLVLIADGESFPVDGMDIDIVLVMDRSGSMNSGSPIKIDVAKDALTSVVDVVRSAGNMNNRAALVSFSSDATIDASLTSNYNSIDSAIAGISAGGSTTIGGGLVAASAELNVNEDLTKKRFIIFASDGQHNTSPSLNVGVSAVPGDVTVYTVGIGSGVDGVTLQDISTQAGSGDGEYYFSDVSDLTAIFEGIINNILNPFMASDVEVIFKKDSNIQTSIFLSAFNPPYDSYTSSTYEVKWNNIGNINDKENSTLGVGFLAADAGQNIGLNNAEVLVNYSINYTLPGGVIASKLCSDSVSIQMVPVNISHRCSGLLPPNSVMCTNDDKEIYNTDQKTITLVGNCTEEKKCEAVCKNCYEKIGNYCSQIKINGQCGLADNKTFCSAPSLKLCSAGSVSSFRINDDSFSWRCNGGCFGVGQDCSAGKNCPIKYREVAP